MKVVNEFSNKLNPLYKKSMIYDNRIEIGRHEIITKSKRVKIYFSYP